MLHPDQGYHVREIARLADIPPGSLHRELKRLAEVGLLSRQRLGNQVRYQANRHCPVFEELAGFFRKTTGLADVVRVFYPTHERLGREVNPVVMSKKEFRGKFLQEDRFVSRIVSEPKTYLVGTSDDLGKLVGGREP